MRIGKKVREQMIDEFENALGKIHRMESVPFHIQRDMATHAANAALAYLERVDIGATANALDKWLAKHPQHKPKGV